MEIITADYLFVTAYNGFYSLKHAGEKRCETKLSDKNISKTFMGGTETLTKDEHLLQKNCKRFYLEFQDYTIEGISKFPKHKNHPRYKYL